MEKEEDNEARKIVDFLEGIDKNKLIKIENFDNDTQLDKDLLRDLRDYVSVATIDSIKNSLEYSLSKWTIILNHLINLDDYFFYLTNKKLDTQVNEKSNVDSDTSSSINSIKSDSSYDNSDITSSSSSSLLNSNIFEKYNYNSIETKDLFEFELSYINKRVKILDIESINVNNFENYVKRFLYIMLFLLNIDYYEFLHPKEPLYKELLYIY